MEDKLSLTAKQKQLIEKAVVVHESLGHTPAAAQILSLLLVSDQLELTFDQVRNTLNLSKSATSNGLKMLIQTQKVEYITKMGERKRYFRSLIMSWKDKLQEMNQHIFDMSKLLQEILDNRTSNSLDFNQSLKEVIDFMKYMEVEFPKLIKNWENKK